MAIWQFGFLIIPEMMVLKKYNGNLDDMKSINFEDFTFWNGYYISESSIEKISKIMNQIQSWSDDIKQFGSLEETCIELLFEKNRLIEVSIRLDLRNLTSDILLTVIDFINDNNALILTQKGILLRPVVEDVIREIKKSDAYSFVKNPQEFLSSLVE